MVRSMHSPLASFTILLGGLFLLVVRVQGLAISYCSPENNAAAYPARYSIYMSNGLCQTTCQGTYAFAVLQGSYCWCSNYVPEPQEDTLECNQVCPGYSAEWCGSTAAGLFGYYQLAGGTPLGTLGASSTVASSSSSPVSPTPKSPSSSLSLQTIPAMQSSPASSPASLVTVAPLESSVQTNSPTVVRSPSTFSETASSAFSSTTPAFSSVASTPSTSDNVPSSTPDSVVPSTTPSSTPVPTEVYTSIVSVTGQVRTILVTPTSTPDATLGQSSTAGGHGVSTGKVVGIVLGVALGLGLLIGLAVWFWLRRKHRENLRGLTPEGGLTPHSSSAPGSTVIPSRQVSQMSSAGLLGRSPRIQTGGFGPSNNPRSADTASSANFDRRSVGTDQRLNPYALYIHDEGRLSNISLQDNQDYSRQLRVANPDEQ